MPQKVSIAGFTQCPYFQKGANVVSSFEHVFPERYEAEIVELDDKSAYLEWLATVVGRIDGASGHKSSPFVWIDDSEYLGGCDDVLEYARKTVFGGGNTGGKGTKVVSAVKDASANGEEYEYDLVVIGGGSGGLSAGKRAAELGAKVALLDFVKPSPQGTSWQIGGTCVNVGCIPKKLFHQSALTGEYIEDAKDFGWQVKKEGHDWGTLVSNVRNYIRSLNFGYKVQLREKGVKFLNKLGTVINPHTVKCVDKKGEESEITAERILIAVGGRPKQLDCPGGDLAITSDDLFFLDKPPGKTLVVGASYVALECASFTTGLGYDTTVMVRSILLRGFDQQMAEKVGEAMEKQGTKFIRQQIPQKMEKMDDDRIKVYYDGGEEIFDTVLAAIGRNPDTSNLGLTDIGLELAKNGKIPTNFEQTEIPSIFAIGDCQVDIPELTPVAIELGKNLSERLYGGSKQSTNLLHVPTAVFAGLEYGCVGLSEDDAKELYPNLEVYHTHFTPLEWTVPEHREYNRCYAKVLVNQDDEDRIVGLHILSPNAGEIIQPYGICLKMGFTWKDLEGLVGIHPTVGEELCLLTEPKSSGKDAVKSGC